MKAVDDSGANSSGREGTVVMSPEACAQAGAVNCRQPGETFFSVVLKISVGFF